MLTVYLLPQWSDEDYSEIWPAVHQYIHMVRFNSVHLKNVTIHLETKTSFTKKLQTFAKRLIVEFPVTASDKTVNLQV